MRLLGGLALGVILASTVPFSTAHGDEPTMPLTLAYEHQIADLVEIEYSQQRIRDLLAGESNFTTTTTRPAAKVVRPSYEQQNRL